MTLRHGFTTGTAAAAAAKAAVLYLSAGVGLSRVDVPLPAGGRLEVPVARVLREGAGGRAVVVKDAGDDPDVTDGAEIHAVVRKTPGTGIAVAGGSGVGRVTLPGLPVAVGEPAINPDPMRQIRAAAAEGLAGANVGIEIVIEVPEGERLAARTMNPRLGIVGGISILGTRGTVVPFSHDSWLASIKQAMDVARAKGYGAMALATGRRSADWIARDKKLPEHAVVEMADFYAMSLKAAARRGFRTVVIASMFGKCVKHALGLENTHARYAQLDFGSLAGWCREAGLDAAAAQFVEGANTGRQVLEIIDGSPARRHILYMLAKKSVTIARGFTGPGPNLEYYVYDYGGNVLASTTNEGDSP